jgi:hypothetical protein
VVGLKLAGRIRRTQGDILIVIRVHFIPRFRIPAISDNRLLSTISGLEGLAWRAPVTVLLALAIASNLFGSEAAPEGLLNRKARIDATLRTIPFQSLPAPAAQAVQEVMDNPSFFRQLPPRVLECDPDLMKFMVRHPEVMVNIWEMIGITNITTVRTGARTFFADDGAGTKCKCELIYSDDQLHIYYGTGDYDGMLTPRPVKGRVVCVLRSQPHPAMQTPSRPMITNRMEVFLKVDNLGADLLTRTLAPLVGKVTEHNFEETSRFVSQLSDFCATYPMAAQRLAEQLTVADESIRQEFESIATRISEKRSLPAYAGTDRASLMAGINDDPAPLRSSLGEIQLATIPEIPVGRAPSPLQSASPPQGTGNMRQTSNVPGPIQPRKPGIDLRR